MVPLSNGAGARAPARRGAKTADDERAIRVELRRFLVGRSEWPTYREFQRAGLKGLRDKITRVGGAERWASEMGVPYVRHPPGYEPVWTEQRIRRDLTDYLAGCEEWPPRDQFERDGLTALRNAVNRTGGADRWAAEFGLRRRDRLSGSGRGWTPETTEATLRELIGDSPVWPTSREFARAGLSSMLNSIYRHEGRAFWARRLGVRIREASPAPDRLVWTEARIRAELDEFCAARDRWPPESEFIAAGRRALYSAASRNGGVGYWAAQLGLTRGRREN